MPEQANSDAVAQKIFRIAMISTVMFVLASFFVLFSPIPG
jgi:hypothetical protein